MKHRYTNQQIANILREMSICYEMKDVAFKPAAYERAAVAIEEMSEAAADILKRDGTKGLERINGVGPAIAEHIRGLLKRGSFKEYTRCRRKMPEDVLELVAVPELGPKKVSALYEKLRIRTLNDLQRAAESGRIRKLPGFGQKTEQKILRGIQLLRQTSQRRLLGDVLPAARHLEMEVGSLSGVQRAVMAGSVRRRRETVGDFDLVITSARPKKAVDELVKLPNVKKVLERGQRNIMLQLNNKMTCDVMVVPDEVFGAALQHFTGNKDHNVEIRKMVAAKGLKLNEYGLWRGKKKLVARQEKDIYRTLGLDYIEPEMRTGSGEIEAALTGKLPKLLPYGSVRGDLQVQTDWTDGTASIEKMAEAALAAGLEYIATTDHTKSLAMVGGLDSKGLSKQAKEIDQVNQKLKSGGKKFFVLKGAEVNILKDGSLDIPDAALKKLDVAGAAIHINFNLPKKEQTERLIRAMKNPHVDIIFHPTGRVIGRREPIALDIERIMRAAKETGTALEINAYPDRSDLSSAHIRLATKLGVKLTINTDAHRPEHFRYLELGEAMARRGWAEKKDVINAKSIEALRRWLAKPKAKRN